MSVLARSRACVCVCVCVCSCFDFPTIDVLSFFKERSCLKRMF